MSSPTSTIEEFANREYEHGFFTDIETETVPRGLNEDIVRLISAKKGEPDWLLEWRLKAPPLSRTLEETRRWPHLTTAPLNYQLPAYYSSPNPQHDTHPPHQ